VEEHKNVGGGPQATLEEARITLPQRRWPVIAWLAVVAMYCAYMVKQLLTTDTNWTFVLFIPALLFLGSRYQIGEAEFRPTRRQWVVWTAIPLIPWLFCVFSVDLFGNFDIGATLFHLQMELSDSLQLEFVELAIRYLGATALFAFAALWLLNKDHRLRRIDRYAAVALALFNPLWPAFAQYAALDQRASNRLLADRYVTPSVAAAPAQPRNVILLYLESIERTFADPAFGNAYMQLAELSTQARTFEGIQQIENTGWTVAGMVASQCGVPLMPAGLIQKNDFDYVARFLPGAVCLGDLLKQQGYQLSFMGGASLEFQGKGLFHRHHGFDRLAGLEEMQDRVAPGYVNDWGLYDDSLLEFAKEEVRTLAGSGRPYLLSILTIAGHFPNGFPAEACLQRQGEFDGEDILYSVRCTGYLVDRFLDELREAGLLRNTTVVLMSDHLAMKNSEWTTLNRLKRTNTFMALDQSGAVRPIAKAGSMVDVFPTLLELLGFQLAPQGRAGLGVSLLGSRPTLLAELGASALDEAIRDDYVLRDRLWRGAAPLLSATCAASGKPSQASHGACPPAAAADPHPPAPKT
jgi:phosphoglycerol transferase